MTSDDDTPHGTTPVGLQAGRGAVRQEADLSTSDVRRVSVLLGVLFGLAGTGSAAAALAVVPLAQSYGVGTGAAAWTISLYALMLGVGTALYGRVADLAGTRFPLLLGLALMTVGALVAALAPVFEVHLVGRLVQGAGVAAVPTIGAAVLSHRYTGAVKSAGLLRLAATAAAVTSLGPLVGGLLVGTLGWRFAIAFPVLGLLVLPFLWSALHVGGTGARLDLVGATLTALAAGGVVLVLQSPSTGLRVAVVGAVLAAVAVPLTVAWTRRRPDGFLPLSVVRNGTVVRSAFAAAAIPAAWFALLLAIPIVLLDRGWEPWQVGAALVPSGVVSLLMPRIAGPVVATVSAANALLFSTAVAAAALVVAALGAGFGIPAVIVLAVVLVTIAFGIGQPALSAAVAAAVEQDVRGVALGVATLVFMVGGSVGSAVVGGLGDAIGIGPSVALLTLLPVVGALLVAPTRRVEASRTLRRPS
jgi:MFS family permease